ncbi:MULTISPECIES: hypothetical protein [unclassified Pseudomonas]|uniref:hypothetical protein n=1 Tax=unclassified Pseudomonas TaxID=196821 RepID=UPI00131CD9CA|nr:MULTISPECIES: hypothetical protein [unclassified Pseudomonas]
MRSHFYEVLLQDGNVLELNADTANLVRLPEGDQWLFQNQVELPALTADGEEDEDAVIELCTVAALPAASVADLAQRL